MINRELIRTKIVQLTYAYYQNGSKNIENAEKELLLSLSKAYDLYNYLLDLIVAVTKEERKRVEQASIRNRREGKAEPSTKFIFNKFEVQLEENKTLNSFNEDKNMSWDGDADLVRKLCDKIEQCDTYKEYMDSPASDYEDDRELWRKLYRLLIEDNEDIDELLESKSIYWNDDLQIMGTFVLKTIRQAEQKPEEDIQLFPQYKDEEDAKFGAELFVDSVRNRDEYRALIDKFINTGSWDPERLAFMDIVILTIAISEIKNYPNIPVVVTMNEYIEIANNYSTAKSGQFINGVLSSIITDLRKSGEIAK